MARFVEDLMLALPIIAGIDWQDQAIVPMPLEEPGSLDLRSLRIAFHTDNGIVSPKRETADVVNSAAKTLAGMGMQVEEARPEAIDQGFEIWAALMAADGGAWIQRLLERYGTTETHPLLRHVLKSTAARGLSGVEFGDLLVRVDEFRSRMLSFMERYDAIVCPVCAFPALPHHATNETDNFPGFSYTAIFNVTGWPASVVRGGTTPDGLPIGVQIVGRPWCEHVVLAVARCLEDALGEWPRPPLQPVREPAAYVKY
jgi:amidase